MENAFMKKGSRKATPAVEIFPFLRFSKLGSAALNNTITGGLGQEGPSRVASIRVEVAVSLDSEWGRKLDCLNQATAVERGTLSVENLTNAPQFCQDKLADVVRSDKKLKLGTTAHFKPDQTKKGSGYGDVDPAEPLFLWPNRVG